MGETKTTSAAAGSPADERGLPLPELVRLARVKAKMLAASTKLDELNRVLTKLQVCEDILAGLPPEVQHGVKG